MSRHTQYTRLKALAATLPGTAPRRELTAQDRAMCQIIAERREMPVSQVIAAAEAVLANPTPEPLQDVAERVAHRRGMTVAEVVRQAQDTVHAAQRTTQRD